MDGRILTAIQRVARWSSIYGEIKAHHEAGVFCQGEADYAESVVDGYLSKGVSLGFIKLVLLDVMYEGDFSDAREDVDELLVWLVAPVAPSEFEIGYTRGHEYSYRDLFLRQPIKHTFSTFESESFFAAADLIEEEMHQVLAELKVHSELFNRDFSVDDFIHDFMESVRAKERKLKYFAINTHSVTDKDLKGAYKKHFSAKRRKAEKEKRRAVSESRLSRMSSGLERVFLTENLDETTLSKIESHADKFEMHLKMVARLGNGSDSLYDVLDAASGTEEYADSLCAESTLSRSKSAIESIISNLEEGFFPGKYTAK